MKEDNYLKIVPTPSSTPNSTSGQVGPRRYKKIGRTTYVITSVFNPDAPSNVLQKIARLIDREVSMK